MTDFDVKSIRNDLKLSQAQFAAEVGVDQGTVSNWENEKTSPSGPARKILEKLRRRAEARRAVSV
jgi:DNA-binding transcriptional regulator YiaG